ncbi:MAG: site-specific DNA-methyltransferase [Anaerolineales bacterium]|nr:site-specific DNA-methyltransferase [Anaerolineales bacterium]MCX7609353.1 site-specific DNA-methyltransferase [Anaerolineales bacterium]MDW8226425.1 site-specific DNA-methyltransferase [Anaerolineales bacterium]
MPSLVWSTKALPKLQQPTELTLQAVIYPQGIGYPEAQPESALYLGDNLSIMAALLEQFEGRLDLIYADPPFFTNRQYAARIGRGEDSRRPAEWQLAEGYADHWDSLDAYLEFLYPRLILMHRLLAPHGTLYLHLDWHANSYARILLDEIFGRKNFVNEIIWVYHGPSAIRRAFNRKHDTILMYTKGPDYLFNTDAVRQAYDPSTIKTFASSPRAGFGKVPDLARGKVPEDWWYFPVVARLHRERTGYPTQKPEALLERILLASSSPGGWVADFFCGSGTFPLVAARHGRRFLAGDASWRAVHTTRRRLVEAGVRPFALYASRAMYASGESPSLTYDYLPGEKRVFLHPPLPELDYWEVDPAWDGRLFRSVAQAWRPWRSPQIPTELTLPVEATNIRLQAVPVRDAS